MPTQFKATVRVQGANGREVNMKLDFGTLTGADQGIEYLAAVAILDEFLQEFEPVTEGTVVWAGITATNYVQAPGTTGDLSETASVVVYIPNVDEPNKTAVLNIPAPVPGLFQQTSGAGKDIVDIGDADLIALVTVFADAPIYVSDGEIVDQTITNGIKSGKRITKAYVPKTL